MRRRQATRPRLRAPADLLRLLQTLRSIHVCRGDQTWLLLDLTMAQLKAVMLLVGTGGVRSRELADGLGIAPSAATALVDRLVAQKLARRGADPADRRIVWIRPAPRAQAVHDQFVDASEQVLADVLGELPASVRPTVKDSVRLLADAAARVLAAYQQRR
jgi:DNA-binding MarR family transcriptional regulator